MPKKKKSTARPTSQQRLLAKARARGARTNPTDEQMAIPAEAVNAYAEVFEWASEEPEAAADLACLHESDWAGTMAGIAFSDHFKFPEDEVLQNAWNFRAWHILNGVKFTLDWPTPISAMSLDEIVQQLRADGAAGKITLEGSGGYPVF